MAILVLAAGKSSRMKGIKQLLKIKNKTLLEIALENATNAIKKNVFCVLGANADKIKSGTSSKNITYIINKNFENGLSSSIVCGIKYIQENHQDYNSVLLLLADQPEIDCNYLQQLINLSRENSTKIVATSYQDNIGVPAVFPNKYFKKLKKLKGDKGAKEFLKNNRSKTIILNREKPFKDIDTPEEYLSYLKSI